MEKAKLRHSAYQKIEVEKKIKNIEDFDELADKINFLLKSKKLDKAINLAETELRKVPETEFHKILGKDLLNRELITATKKTIDDYDKSVKAGKKNKRLC